MKVRAAWSLVVTLSVIATPSSALHQQEKPAPESAPAPSASEPAQPSSDPNQNRKTGAATSPTKPSRKHRGAKRTSSPEPPGTPTKTVVREGGVDEPSAQIVTGMSPEEAARQRQESELLLSTTAEMLKEIAPRPLGAEQQETVSQIHNYMDLSRDALKEGDIQRAHTLAQKANLLAEDLRKH